MPSDATWRFVVKELLDVRPEGCLEVARAVAARHPYDRRARALAQRALVREIAVGMLPGLAKGPTRAALLALLEARAHVRQRALLRACVHVMEDPRFFERSDWGRRALGLERGGGRELAREVRRTVLHFTLVRAARRSFGRIGPRVAAIAGAGTGFVVTLLDHRRFTADGFGVRRPSAPDARRSHATVIRLPLERRENGRMRP